MRTVNPASYKLIERPIYGSSRVGIDNTPLELIGYTAPTSGILTHELGLKQYELVNHLGNVLTTVSDKKIPVDIDNDGIIDYYVADITSATDYYPFGSPMDGRAFSGEKYRFGFGGKELDNEIQGDGNSYDFGARIYDSRLGKWLSCDPLADETPSWTPYRYCFNNPIKLIDPDGRSEGDGVILTGDEAARQETKNQMNNGFSEGFKVDIDSDGRMNYSGEAQSTKERDIKAAIDDPKIDVYLKCTYDNYVKDFFTEKMTSIIGGAFFGSGVCGDKVMAIQAYNPEHGNILERNNAGPASETSAHELMEAYDGAKLSRGINTNSKPEDYDAAYIEAHGAAAWKSGGFRIFDVKGTNLGTKNNPIPTGFMNINNVPCDIHGQNKKSKN